jgi:hypothetical protein
MVRYRDPVASWTNPSIGDREDWIGIEDGAMARRRSREGQNGTFGSVGAVIAG